LNARHKSRVYFWHEADVTATLAKSALTPSDVSFATNIHAANDKRVSTLTDGVRFWNCFTAASFAASSASAQFYVRSPEVDQGEAD
jgi:hypothetical protein